MTKMLAFPWSRWPERPEQVLEQQVPEQRALLPVLVGWASAASPLVSAHLGLSLWAAVARVATPAATDPRLFR